MYRVAALATVVALTPLKKVVVLALLEDAGGG